MPKVYFYDTSEHVLDGTHFATFDMEVVPRFGDLVEIGFPNEQIVKTFHVSRVVHKMIQLQREEIRYVEGVPVSCKIDPPWRWEVRLYGSLFNPKKEVPPANPIKQIG